MLRYPTLSSSDIAFVYASSLWVVDKHGGTARPVASPAGSVSWPRFSPDGKTIAFVANLDGNRDIYTLPTGGGIAHRVTHHPGNETLVGWTNADTLLFFTNALAGNARQNQVFTVSADGGLPSKLPVPYGTFSSISADGKWMAYTPHSTDNRTWKRYRGGMATDIWLVNLHDGTSKRATDWEGTDTLPMFGPAKNGGAQSVYYLSDAGAEHRLNVWSYDVSSGTKTQITKFADDDVRWPSMGFGGTAGEIVFQLGAKLMLLDLANGQAKEVAVSIPGARPKISPRLVDASENITSWSISPSAKRVAIVGRGDIWSVPAKEGPARNLTHTDVEFERDASWSPDGKWIAYFSDKSGEYELWVRPSDARPAESEKKDDKSEKSEKGEAKSDDKSDSKSDKSDAAAEQPGKKFEPTKLTSLGEGFRANPTWSPDSKHVAFTDQDGNLRVATLTVDDKGGTVSASVKVVDTDPWMETPSYSWSHDSSWIAYTRGNDQNTQTSIWLYKVTGDDAGTKTKVTSGMFDCGSPTFDHRGEVLFYRASNRWAVPKYADNDSTFIYAGTQHLMMLPLRMDVKNPLAPRSDEEELKKDAAKKDDKKPADKPSGDKPAEKSDAKPDGESKSDDAKGDDKKHDEKKDESKNGESKKDDSKKDSAKKDEPKKPLKIDLENMEARSLLVPVPPGNFGQIAVSEDGKLIYVRVAARGEDDGPSGGAGSRAGIKLFDLKAASSGEKKDEETIIDNVNGFDITPKGNKLLVRTQGKFKIIDPVAGGGKGQDVSTGGMRQMVQPRDEWKQIFTDAWRLQRDFFYVKNMHGVDWPKMREHYGKMLDDAASREDVQYILGELISELNIGHAYVQAPGDIGDQGPNLGVGLLGADYDLVGKPGEPGSAYRFRTIYEGAAWDADARSPLAQNEPGKRVKPGEYLLAVNGQPVDTTRDPWAAFIGLVDRPTMITVSDKPTLDAPGSREVLVKPIANEGTLRYRAWVERNRAYVDAKSNGKVAYIHVPDTGINGQNELFRQFFGQRHKAAMLIDERWNGGGQLPNRFIELLNRPVTCYFAKREGNDWTIPQDSHQGPKAMLANGLAGSGGDMFPWLFKHEKLGKLLGTRTWGGLVGISGNPGFIDGGSMTVPQFGFYETDGTWGVEGHGVDPDIEVIDDPALMMDTTGPAGPQASIVGPWDPSTAKCTGKGGDPQLDAAVAYLLDEVTKHPYVAPKRPTPPDRKGMGLPESDK